MVSIGWFYSRKNTIPGIYAGNLRVDLTEKEFTGLFAKHRRGRASKWVHDLFSGRYVDFGFIEIEGHEARIAIRTLNGRILRGKSLRVNEEYSRNKSGRGRRR